MKSILLIISTFLGFLVSTLTYGQDTIGVYYRIDKTKIGPSFATKLILFSDSTFKYTFNGDLFNDFAEGTFDQTVNLIRLHYKTLDYSSFTIPKVETINTQPPTTISLNEEYKFPNPTSYLWPTEIIKRRNSLIVIRTKGDDRVIKKRFKKIKASR